MKLNSISRILSVSVLALGLAGCSSDRTGTSGYDQISELASDLFSRGDQPTDQPPISGVNRAAISDVNVPLTMVAIPEIDATALVQVKARNNGVWTWATADDITVSMDGPVLFSTRGIGPDLLTAETRALRGMLERGQVGSYSRDLRYLDGLDQIQVVSLNCSLGSVGSETVNVLEQIHTTRHMREVCTSGDGQSIQNDYWLGRDGTPWQTRQWVSETLGYAATQRLVK
ncbi:YjbF family lipoprotein [Qingshengfaniella alkalisoli]|nr:YjbF family lipoprotein [Qingshengfaniella alkalisoli]